MKTHDQARAGIEFELRRRRFSLAPTALEPLRQIDFASLVDVYDHEERFLETTFIGSLEALREAYSSIGVGKARITAEDVETAIRMVGAAAPRQPEQVLSMASKSKIKAACGFCRQR